MFLLFERLRQFNDHLTHILSLEKTDESSYRLVYSFHHRLLVLQLIMCVMAVSFVLLPG
jgi:hypothetical protein